MHPRCNPMRPGCHPVVSRLLRETSDSRLSTRAASPSPISASSSLSSSTIAEESRVARSPTAEEIHEDARAAEAAAEAAKEEAQIAHRRATKAHLPAARAPAPLLGPFSPTPPPAFIFCACCLLLRRVSSLRRGSQEMRSCSSLQLSASPLPSPPQSRTGPRPCPHLHPDAHQVYLSVFPRVSSFEPGSPVPPPPRSPPPSAIPPPPKEAPSRQSDSVDQQRR